MKYKKIISDFWLENYVETDTNSGLCVLCGNTGEIKCKDVISPNGIKLKDRKVFCLCPNGRYMKKNNLKGVRE